jgi:ABC-2 type transport system permease protein
MLRLLVRSHRVGFVIVAIFSMFDVLTNTAAYAQVAGSSEAARRAFAAATQPLATQLSYLLPIPSHLDTVGGYVSWRAYPVIAIGFVIWAVVAGTGLVRGEEERGLTDVYLSAGVGRVRWTLIRSLAFAVASAVAVVLTQLAGAAGIAAAGHAAGQPLSWGELTGQGVALWAIGLAGFGITLVLSQLVSTRGAAAGLSAVVFAVLFFLNSLSRTTTSWRGAAHISPFFLFDQNYVLTPGVHFDPVAAAVLVVIGVVGIGLSAAVFAVRDLGAPVLRAGGSRRARPARRDPSRNPLLRVPVLSTLWEHKWSLLAWMVGSYLLMALIGGVAKSGANLIEQTPSLQVWLQPGVKPFTAMVSATWGSIIGLVVAAYAIVETARWAGQDGSGRLELTLAEPVSRWRVVVQRAIELGVGALLITVAGTLGLLIAAAGQHETIGGPVWGATFLLLPVATAFGAIGGAISAWLPRLAIGVISVIAVAAFFIQLFAPIFKAPSWVLNLSLFQLYGTPLTKPVFWEGFWALIAITVVGFGIAVLAMQRREVGS